MEIAKYIRHWIEQLPFKKGLTTTSPEQCCISLTSSECFLLHTKQLADTLEILHAESFFYESTEVLNTKLNAIVQRDNLNNIPVSWLLQPENYQIFIIESLPVEESEIRDALNWRIRSLISHPIEETIMDYFAMPAKKSSTDNQLIAAVTAWTNSLNKFIEIIENAGLNLKTIDIPELALKRLTSLYEDDARSTGFIYFYNNLALLNITREKTLYFSRHINFTIDIMNPNFEQFSLDVLRFFDYFQSQWRLPTPTRVFIGTESKDVNITAKSLTEYLQVSVEPYILKIKIDDPVKRDLTQKQFLLNIGCILNG